MGFGICKIDKTFIGRDSRKETFQKKAANDIN